MRRVAFIGCGYMGGALLSGILKKGLLKRSYITVADSWAARRNMIKKIYDVKVTSSNSEAVKRSDIVMLCIKPQEMSVVLGELKSALKDKLTISIAAGITNSYIKKKTGAKRVIRVMPNSPAVIGYGMSVIAPAIGVGARDIKTAMRIFSCVGDVFRLPEKQIDAVTAVSGSGPAYFFLLMKAVVESAISCGLNEGIAKRLVLQTALGAVKLWQELDIPLPVLRKQVASKGGTTEAALKVFKKHDFERLVEDAIKAAASRAKELSR